MANVNTVEEDEETDDEETDDEGEDDQQMDINVNEQSFNFSDFVKK